MDNALPIVEIRNLSKSYRRGSQTLPVLIDISLDIDKGEFLALMGPSGSGKTTLLNLIAGIDKADSGSIKVSGIEITSLSETELALVARFQCRFYLPVLQSHSGPDSL